jgi:hypothetical protein
MSSYRVKGPLSYRGHQPGEVFQARLNSDAERRAVGRGSIEILDTTPPGLVPGSYRPPDGWDHNTSELEAPSGPFSLKGATPNG